MFALRIALKDRDDVSHQSKEKACSLSIMKVFNSSLTKVGIGSSWLFLSPGGNKDLDNQHKIFDTLATAIILSNYFVSLTQWFCVFC